MSLLSLLIVTICVQVRENWALHNDEMYFFIFKMGYTFCTKTKASLLQSAYKHSILYF